jgi:ferredoxin
MTDEGRCIGCDAKCDSMDYCHGCHVYVCEDCEESPQTRSRKHSPWDHLDLPPDEVVQ